MNTTLPPPLLMLIKGLSSLLLLSLLSACDNSIAIPETPIRTVRITTLMESSPILQRHFTGRVEAISTVSLSFQVPGKLIKLSAQEGTLIPTGRVIAVLEDTDYRLAVQQAKAQFNLAELDLKRKRNLQKSGSLPKAMLDQAETSFKLNRVALETAQRNLSYTKIIAPFDALISNRLVDNYANVSTYQPIVRVQELTELRVHINIPEDMVHLLKKPELFNAIAVFKERPTQRFPLSYREHNTEAGSVAQTYDVTFGLSRKQNESILPGMTVGVIISKKASDSTTELTIPISALDYTPSGTPRVWIYHPQTKTVTPRHITLGTMRKQTIPVLSGLKAGEQIVTAGAHLLHDGMVVRPFIAY